MNKVNVDRIFEAITAINSDAEITITGEDLDTIVWIVGDPISKSDIETKIAELKTVYDAKNYQRKRAAEYPSIADQLDDIYHNGIDAWKATIKTTKDKYPKE
jgi:hypothetical protein